MLRRTLSLALRRSEGVGLPTVAASGARCASEWLRGRPPVVNAGAGTLASFYYNNVREHPLPTKDSIVSAGNKINISGLDNTVYSYALGFIDGLSLKRGHRVAVWMSDELENAVVQFASTLAGASVVAIDPQLGWDAVLRILGKEDPRVLFFSPRLGMELRAETAKEHLAVELEPFETGTIYGYAPLTSKRFRGLKYLVQSGSEIIPGLINLTDLPIHGDGGKYSIDGVAVAQTGVTATDAASVYYTAAPSGGAESSSEVRGKPASQAELLATAAASAAAQGLKSTDTVVVVAPLSGLFGLSAGVMAALHVSARTVLPAKTFDACKTLAAITEHRATHLVCTQAQANALAALAAQDAAKGDGRAYSLGTLRGGLVLAQPGAAPASLGSAALKPVDGSKLPALAAFV